MDIVNILYRNYRFRILNIVTCFLLLTKIGYTQSFSTILSVNKIGKNELVEVQYEIANAQQIDQFQAPSFKDWIIVSGPNNSSISSSINGRTTYKTVISYSLQPKKTGRLEVEGAKAFINGKPISSNKQYVEVLNKNVSQQNNSASIDPFANFFNDPFFSPSSSQAAEPDESDFLDAEILKPGENIIKKINDNLFIKVITDKTTCYEGEPIVVEYKLYYRLDMTGKVSKRPTFNGFSSYDMEDVNQPSVIEMLNGKRYKVASIKKAQLYPLQTGMLSMEPAEVDCSIRFKRGDQIFAGTFNPLSTIGYIDTSFTVRSNAVKINVLPLPSLNKPTVFKGAVGNFEINAEVKNSSISTDEAGSLTIQISGSGNFSMVQAPQIKWPSGVEAYEPVQKENLVNTVAPISGQKTFEYVFLPHQKGKIIIPPVQFSFFDIVSKTYKTLQTKPVDLNITQGKEKVNKNFADSKNTNWPLTFTFFAQKILPLLAGALLLVAIITFFYRRRRELATNKKEKIILKNNNIHDSLENAEQLKEVSNSSLTQAEAALYQEDNNIFYKSLKNEILQNLALYTRQHTANKELLYNTLRQKGIDSNHIQQINSILDECDAAIYSPIKNITDRHKALEEAKFLLEYLNKN